MSRYCSDCCFLNTGDEKCSGVYKCSKIKEYTNAYKPACDKFEMSYRRSFEKQRLYDLGKEANNKSSETSILPYICLVIILFIVWLIAKINGY